MDTKTILLVEDNADDEKLILMSLRQGNIGNEVAVARDGQEALDLVFGGAAKTAARALHLPVVVLLDLHLPKIDGLEVLQRIRADERTRLLPVVVLTSSKEERDRVESYSLGANSYVCKPVDFGEFADAVRELGLYWVLLNTPARD
ncbi:MAG TPA: response regulator [Elusimicrobiota bacterium]|jgi:two-component system response regulator|nr:response regulator [Elusimicrobiota bacterium]